MIAMAPIRRAVLHALSLAGNMVAYQRVLIAYLEQDWVAAGGVVRHSGLMQAIEQAAIAKALGWTE